MGTKPSTLVITALLLIAIATFSACRTTAVAQANENESQAIARLIAKPRQPVGDGQALLAAIRRQLPSEQRVTILREMSGGAYVLNIIAPATKEDVPTIIAQLIATELFEYVEEDRMMKIQR